MADGRHSALHPIDIDQVLASPKAYFDAPADVLSHPALSNKFKLRILHEWEVDARLLAEADSEGMGGGEETMLARVRTALRELDADAADGSIHLTSQGEGQGLIEDVRTEFRSIRVAIRALPLTLSLGAFAVGWLCGRLSPRAKRHT